MKTKTMAGHYSSWWVRLVALVCLLGFGSTPVIANDAAEEVRLVVETNIAMMLDTYERERVHFETDPQRFYRSMDEAISHIVDFRRIAARVMGKYARRATKDQRGEFTAVFKDSLFSTYTKTLVESGNFRIKVVKSTLNSRSDSRASVDMEVTSDSGNVYPVTYSMHKAKSGQWLMENVIVFGVNVGLAFKDKFEAQYRANKGNIAAVIRDWTVDVGLKVPNVALNSEKEG